MRLIKFILLIPVRYNDGSNVSDAVLQQMLDELFGVAKGWTQAGRVIGAYQMSDGTKQLDESVSVWIWVRPRKISALKKLVGTFAARLGQESMYLEESTGTVSFIPPKDR